MLKKNIKDLTLEELEKIVAVLGEPAYRAKQIFSWLYQKGAASFEQMSTISQTLRNKLEKKYVIGTVELSAQLRSSDGTEKFLFKLADGTFIESVLIFAQERKTVCLSTQVGCKFACSFCASGRRGFVRNLLPGEITNQILFLQHKLKHKITNYVFMGMGEPLDNFNNLSKAIMIMDAKEGMNIGSRRITVSTCGIIPGIEKLKKLNPQINLSVSLHAADDQLRDTLVPINRRYRLKELISSCANFAGKLTLEYVLIKDKNDALQQADQLAKIAKRLGAKVNLIPLSRVTGLDLEPTPGEETGIFLKRLLKQGVQATLRESKGRDISAACGQLAGKLK
ncbi:MAG: 23S rRNA (adenine(2503)-C(2))-methyltransferase RlmN [Candidatus Omnitrophica bacterium]|nr:23S rRNA (adenine(2503)-C(2))-methyltransferase RlmN [Candidatus Omnitrophota bacterium]